MAAAGDIKLPTYNRNINAWLAHVDAFLGEIPDITDGARYGALLGAIPTDIISGVQHILDNPPATGSRYQTLKDALKTRYVKEDDESNYQQLLTITQGDMLPSELLQEMKRLNGRRVGKLPPSVLRSMHLNKLQSEIQPLIEAVGSALDDDEYATLADKVFKRQNRAAINAVMLDTGPDVNALHNKRDEISELRREVRDLKDCLAKYIDNNKSTTRRSNTSSTAHLTPDICYYHNKFGPDAKRCQPPCKFKSQGNFKRGRW